LWTGYPVYLISTNGAWQVWPVSRGSFLLHGTWSCLHFCLGSVLSHTLLCMWFLFWVMVTFNVNFANWEFLRKLGSLCTLKKVGSWTICVYIICFYTCIIRIVRRHDYVSNLCNDLFYVFGYISHRHTNIIPNKLWVQHV
jgi:hypothetical protein